LLALPSLDDSSVAQWLDRSIAAVDVGAGAGFPGLPLKLVWPGLQLALVEATGKKCRFLEQVVAELKLDGVTVINARAEDFGQGEGRERFDLALGRAVSKLPTLLEYTLPLLRMGGCLIAQKGQDPGEELTRTRTALHTLGGSLHQVLPITVPGLKAQRTLVVVVKAGPTPAAYPRRAGLPQRQPLL
jgi:16S rRNA (guanine527-N7)-methyltransferase